MQITPRRYLALAATALCGALLLLGGGCSSSTSEGNPQPPEPAAPVAVAPTPPVEPAPAIEVQPAAVVGDEHNPLRETGTNQPGPEEPKKDNWGKGKHSGEKFDPVKENGTIFVGWPKPTVALVLTGQQMGYLEPCGCAGLDRMKGGLSRRFSMIRDLREKGWPLAVLDVGGFSKGFGLQAEMKFHLTADAMRKMGYDAVGLGTADLRMPTTDLVSEATPVSDKPGLLISSNVGLFGFDAGFTGQSRVVEAGGKKIGAISVVGLQAQKQINNSELEMADPAVVLAKQVPELRKKCDILVLLAHATMEESIALGQKFPDFDLVVTAGGAPEPPSDATIIKGTQKTRLIEVGEKGMNAIVVGYFDGQTPAFRYQRVPLDSRFENAIPMKQLMAAYQDQLKDLGLAGLGIRAVSHPKAELCGGFVGSDACKKCHEVSYDIWKKSGHARAWKTLKELDPPRNFDPECISCHVDGWNPQKYFPYQTGFHSEAQTPQLVNTGCEDCHGPGENHCKEEELIRDRDLMDKLRKAAVVTKEESEKRTCLECHDLDNSPDFDFKEYWPHVEHYE